MKKVYRQKILLDDIFIKRTGNHQYILPKYLRLIVFADRKRATQSADSCNKRGSGYSIVTVSKHS